MKKVLTVVGARPQFVKAAVVSRALRRSSLLSEVMVHTGQHFDDRMSGNFFRDLDVPEPKHNLGISSLSHGAMTGRMLERIEEVMLAESPSMVLVYGDTNSTLAGALAARKLQLPLAHVEAGLRSFDMTMPEEVNRVLTDRISDVLYCPTETAVKNLDAEGFKGFDSRVLYVGDVMFDAVLSFRNSRSAIEIEASAERFALCTIHRAENVDDGERLRRIFEALDEIADEIDVVIPIHPRTRAAVQRWGVKTRAHLIEPVGYGEMLDLLSRSSIVFTDSGGLQKEAFFLKKYCITLRDSTEWTELLDAGVNVLVGADRDSIVNAFRTAINTKHEFSARPYGSGNAGHMIVEDLEAFLG